MSWSINETQTILIAVLAGITILIPACTAVVVLLIKQLGVIRNTWYETMRQSDTLNHTITPALSDVRAAVNGGPIPHGDQPIVTPASPATPVGGADPGNPGSPG